MSSSRYRQVLACLFVALVSGCDHVEEDVLSTNATYAVFDVTPVKGVSDGRVGPVRIALLVPARRDSELMQEAAEGLTSDCLRGVCEAAALKRGAVLLHSLWATRDMLIVPDSFTPGQQRVVSSAQLYFQSFHRAENGMRLGGVDGAQAEANVTLLHKCTAKVVRVRTPVSVSSGGGIIATSKTKWVQTIEVKKPPCFAESDLQFELLSAEETAAREKERAEAEAAEKAKAAELDAQYKARIAEQTKVREDKRAAAVEALKRRAAEYAAAHPASGKGWKELSALEQKLNPELAGLFAAAGLRELLFEYRCLGRKGRRTTRCSHHATLMRMTGSDAALRYVNSPYSEPRSALFTRLSIDSNGWLRVALAGSSVDPAAVETSIRETVMFAAKIADAPDLHRGSVETYSFVTPVRD